MTTEKIIFTLFAKDRPGIISDLSSAVLTQKASWLHSSVSRVCGQFIGIVQVETSAERKSALLSALTELSERGIKVTVQQTEGFAADTAEVEGVQLLIEATDRPGIIEEITAALDDASINIDQMDTELASENDVSMFRAHLFIVLPDDVSEDDLQSIFDGLADDVSVSVLDE